ncbi:Kelch-type beta propeller-containing protein [Dioscorea alata]|uniref:Kelch-type beta propeller-containing protein n=1 Tax=Dioscorea alata TaxID=55571 RepID=A0ACB7UHL1_DIOAL|nr:Kelch-type beta propeller-containing protein [Dioscorea alata]
MQIQIGRNPMEIQHHHHHHHHHHLSPASQTTSPSSASPTFLSLPTTRASSPLPGTTRSPPLLSAVPSPPPPFPTSSSSPSTALLSASAGSLSTPNPLLPGFPSLLCLSLLPLPLPSLPPSPSPPFLVRVLLFVLGGMLSGSLAPLSTLLLYRTSTNSWLLSSSMPTPRAFFSAAAISGRIIVAGGDSHDPDTSVDRYDPNTNHWSSAAPMPQTLPLYDSAVIGHRFFVTGGWTWPFDDLPRGSFYDADKDTWEEMQRGMREGWTGVSAVVSGRLFVVSECGEARVKAYDVDADTWQKVDGGSVPAAVGRPYAVCGGEGKIYVVGSGLDVAVGSVVVDEDEGERIMGMEWEVIKAPDEYALLAPISCQLIYA